MEAYIESIEEINREMNIALKEKYLPAWEDGHFDMDNTLLKVVLSMRVRANLALPQHWKTCANKKQTR